MRNLKRALSLLLAVVMVIGMMVVGASAASLDDFSDKDEIVNKDAVSMLTILGVINGKEDGSYFDPTGNVTRAEMAKMIATILNQGADVDGLYVGMNTGLTDVSGHWAESYINYCYSLGIIAGRGNGKFDPAATVTGNEAAKMLLVAAGYDAEIEGLTGSDWAIRTASLASTLGIFDGLNASTGDALTRDNAALLIYNALDIEMIQKYENGYAIAFNDNRTLLSTKYGVYKVEGVVIGNEEAALDGTDSDESLASGKTRMDHVKVYASTTKNTVTGEYEEEKNPVTFNVSTTADMLGKTVTMYVKKTTVLANSQVLGIYLNDNNNVIEVSVSTEDSMKDFLKGTGLSVTSARDDEETEYYVNYGAVDSESDATKAMGFESGDRFDSVKDKTNGYGIEMTVIDNDNDGVVEYVLYKQETLTQVIAKSSSKETTTLNGFNKNSAIDDEDIVTDADLSEGDLALVVSYGGKYYVSAPQVVTGQMESYQASKTKEQTIKVDGTDYHPSYIQYAADAADNTYEFNIADCGTEDGVDFDTDYDFILDSNGNVIAYQPSEEGLYDYALILDSGYEPGAFASDASGKVKVLLADGTEGTYTLNFSDSAKNVGKQIAADLNSETYSTNQGIQELKAFLGTSDSDNSNTAPWQAAIGGTGAFAHKDINTTGTNNGVINANDYRDGQAKGYVIGYSLNSDNELTIKSIVGTNNDLNKVTYDPADVNDELSSAYDSGSARIRYDNGNKQVAVDRNTVAFYYTTNSKGDVVYGVAVGYNEMSDVAKDVDFVAGYTRNSTSLAGVVLFDAEGVQAEKDYVYVLSRNTVNSNRAILNVVYMDGTVGEMTIDRDDYDDIFENNDDFGTVYAYTTGTNGISELTGLDQDSSLPVIYGYARQLNSGTIAVYSDKAMTKPVGTDYTFSYDQQIWNVEDVSADDEKAPAGNFSRNVGREVVLVLDSKLNEVRAAYIKSVLDGVYTGAISVSTAAETGLNTNSTKLATATVTLPSGGTGTLSYQWYKCDNASGRNPVAVDSNYTVNSTGTTSILNVKAGTLTAGDHYFKVVVTYTESGKVSTTDEDVVTVSVAAAPAAGSLSISTDLTTPTVLNGTTRVDEVSGTSLFLGFSEGDRVQIASSDIKANTYWMVNGEIIRADGNGVLRFTMPGNSLSINKADQHVKYITGEGVSLSDVDANGFAPVGTAQTIAVNAANGTGVLVSNDGKLQAAATGAATGSAIANSGSFTPAVTDIDVYMNAAAKVTATGVELKLESSTGATINANDYVLVGAKVFAEASAVGTSGDVILVNTKTAAGDNATSSDGSATKASVIYTMTAADADFTTGAKNP